MAFAKQKLNEVKELAEIMEGNTPLLVENIKALSARNLSKLIHKQAIKQRVAAITTDAMLTAQANLRPGKKSSRTGLNYRYFLQLLLARSRKRMISASCGPN
jgi:hypothetical protein